MRALTIRQPWADLIVAGVKDVENRTWPVPSTLPCVRPGGPHDHRGDERLTCTPFPFTIAVHAAKRWDPNEWRGAVIVGYDGDARDELELIRHAGPSALGAFVGTVDALGFHEPTFCAASDEGTCSPWAMPDHYHWELANAARFDVPILAKGRQGLWILTDEQAAEVEQVVAA